VSVVSVVTPFYNTAAYLAECIESVLAQTLPDFEYVLLDNCSTDGSRAIAERYAARDSRIRLHHNDALLPQVPNYNRALTLVGAASRYVKLVQADDSIYPHCLEEMVALADAHPSVALVGSYFHHGKVEPAEMPHTAQVLSGRDACRKMLLDGVFLFGSPTTLLMRADVVRARVPFYAEGRMHEDTEVCYEILRDHDFGFVPQLLSFSRLDPSSIMGSATTFHPALLDRLIRLRLYGREFLTEDEYRHHATAHERRYRQMLAEAWLRRREPEFWSYHKRGLATIDVAIEPLDLARDATVVVVREALRAPGRGMDLLRWVRGKR
jgi:glycosyltransferase involved in cell wall biosynthesis